MARPAPSSSSRSPRATRRTQEGRTDMSRHERLARMAIMLVAAALVAACTTPTTTAPTNGTQPLAAGTAKPSATAAAASPQPLQIVGKFAVEPAHGPWDTKVTATASGLAPNTKYDLVWTTATGSWKLSDDRSKYVGREYRPVQKVLQSPTTDGSGAFSATFAVPQGFGYAHDVMVIDPSKTIRNTSLFDVDMETRITPTSGPVGTPITIEVRGIGWQSYQNSFQLAYDNAYTGWVSSITTDGYAKVVIPATGQPGTHYITLGHSEFGAPYMNPNQQPVVASRPFPHIAFTVTEGAAVKAAAAETQGFAQIAARPVAQGIWSAPYGATVGTPATLNGRAIAANSDIELQWTTMVGNRSV